MMSYEELIQINAALHKVDPKMIHAICIKESSMQADAFRFEPNFWANYLANNPKYKTDNPRRVSSSYGLMQIMYPTAQNAGFPYEPEWLFQPNLNLFWGCKIVRGLLDWAETTPHAQTLSYIALAAYNAGKGGAMGKLGKLYADSVLAILAKL